MRLLCLSDIHGHAEALSAVLATAERRGYTRVLVAGDICFPGPEPLRTWRRLSQLNAVCVQGVGDRALAMVDADTLRPRDEFERTRLRRLLEVREELGDALLRQIAKLPQMARVPLEAGRQLLVVHGSPLDPLEPMTHDMDEVAISAMLGEDPADVVLCGGSHVPFDRMIPRHLAGHAHPGGAERLSRERLRRLGDQPDPPGVVPAVTRVINLGSVGEAPCGDEPPFAHATFVESTDGGIDVEQFVVPLGRAA
jgi:predicted phosphodiesterase